MSPLTVEPAGHVRLERVNVGLVAFDPLTATGAATYVRDALARGVGGLLAVVDTDLHRRVADQPELRTELEDATLVLAQSGPAVWASRLTGRPLPRRVAGSALVEALCAACTADGHRVYVIGGAPGGRGVPGGALRAAAVLGLRHRGLRIAGCASPPVGFDSNPVAWAELLADVGEAKPDLVLMSGAAAVADMVVAALAPELPGTWFFGCAGLVEGVLGERRRRRAWRDPAVLAHAAGLLIRAALARIAGRS